jgi:hypothetical protein
MSKKSKARHEAIIRSMEGLSALKAPESRPATPVKPKMGKPKFAIGLAGGIVFALFVLWFFRR